MGKSFKKPKERIIRKDEFIQVHRRTNKQILKNAIDEGKEDFSFKDLDLISNKEEK